MKKHFPIIEYLNDNIKNRLEVEFQDPETNIKDKFVVIDFGLSNLVKDEDKNEEFWKGHIAGSIMCLYCLGLIDYDAYDKATFELLNKEGGQAE